MRARDHRIRLAGVLDSELTKRDRSIEHVLSWDEIQDIAEAVAKADREATSADWVELQKRDPDITSYLFECTHALEDFTRAELKALGNVKTALSAARQAGFREGVEAAVNFIGDAKDLGMTRQETIAALAANPGETK